MRHSSTQWWPLKLVLLAIYYEFWILATPVLGVAALWRVAQWIRNQRHRLGQVSRCARGHQVPLYGVYECHCGAIHEGHVFGPCQVCQETCGWTPCLECGLPVGNPWL